MSETLRDLVVSLSLNSDNFTRNIKSVNKQIQEAQAEFRNLASGVENFEGTADGLSSKMSTLQRTFTLQQEVVGQYSKALDAARNKLAECYARQLEYADKLREAKEAQNNATRALRDAQDDLERAKTLYKDDADALAYAEERLKKFEAAHKAATDEVKKLEGQETALIKATQNAADAVSTGNVKLYDAKSALNQIQSEINATDKALKYSVRNWNDAQTAMESSLSGISSLGREMQIAEADFRLAAAGVKDFSSSEDGLQAKLELLNTKLNLQKQTVNEYTKVLIAAKQQLSAAESMNDPERISIATENVQKAQIALKNAGTAVKQTEADIVNCNSALTLAQTNWSSAEQAIQANQITITSLGKQIKISESDYNKAASSVKDFSETTEGLSAKLEMLESKHKLQVKALTSYRDALKNAKVQLEAAKQANDPEKIQQATSAVQDAQIALNNAQAAVGKTKQEIQTCNEALAVSKSNWGSASNAMDASKVAITSIGKQLQTVESKLKLAAAGVKDFDTSAEGLSTKLSSLTEKLNLQKRAVAQYEAGLKAAKAQLKAAQELNDPAKIQQATAAVQDAKTALNNAKAAVKQTEADIKDCNTALSLAKTSWDAAGNAAKEAESEIASIGKQMKMAESRFKLASAGIKNFDKSAEGLSAKLVLLKEKLDLQNQSVVQYEAALKAAKQQLEAAKQANDPTKIRQATDAIESATASLNEAKAAVKQTQSEIKTCNKDLTAAKSRWTEVGNSMESFSKKCTKSSEAMSQLGQLLTATATTAVAALGAVAVKSSIEYESAFTSVRKTTNATEAQFAELEAAVKQMSTEIAASTTEIAEVMATGGQLGIATENLEEFTRVMIDLGNSCEDLDAENAATTIAQFANVMGTDQSMFSNIGSTIVELGNNFATTESPIMEMAQRLAGAGKQVGLTESEILGFSAALSSVGISAEMGGSAFSKALINMEVAVETGNESLTDFANVAGMTTTQFQTLWKANPADAFIQFINGLSQMDDEGISAVATLNDIGISEVRLRDTLLRSVNAVDVFTEAVDMADRAWKENTALSTEANKRYATTASKLTNLKNKALLVAQAFGDDLNPVIKDLVSGVSDFLDKLGEMDSADRQTIMRLAMVAAAIGPVLLLIGKGNAAIGALTSGISKFALTAANAGGGVSGLWVAVKGLLGPVGIAALAAALAYGTYKLIDWASGAKAAREATEDMIDIAEQMKETQADTIYDTGTSDPLARFGVDEDSFTNSKNGAQSWFDSLIAEWTDGEKETDEIVQSFIDTFTDDSDEVRTAIQDRSELLGNLGTLTPEQQEQMQKDLEQLDSWDEEISKLLKKRKSGTLTEKDQERLTEIITLRTKLQLQYSSGGSTEGYQGVLQGLHSEIERTTASGGMITEDVYGDALNALAQGRQAYLDSLNETYDAQYAQVMLIEDETERTAALLALNQLYNEQRDQNEKEYQEAVKETATEAFENGAYEEQIEQFNNLASLIGQGAAPTELLEWAENIDEGKMASMLALVEQLKASGATDSELAQLGIDADTLLTTLQQVRDIASGTEGMEGLATIFGEAIPEEVQRILVGLDMTQAAADWTAFMEGKDPWTSNGTLELNEVDDEIVTTWQENNKDVTITGPAVKLGIGLGENWQRTVQQKLNLGLLRVYGSDGVEIKATPEVVSLLTDSDVVQYGDDGTLHISITPDVVSEAEVNVRINPLEQDQIDTWESENKDKELDGPIARINLKFGSTWKEILLAKYNQGLLQIFGTDGAQLEITPEVLEQLTKNDLVAMDTDGKVYVQIVPKIGTPEAVETAEENSEEQRTVFTILGNDGSTNTSVDNIYQQVHQLNELRTQIDELKESGEEYNEEGWSLTELENQYNSLAMSTDLLSNAFMALDEVDYTNIGSQIATLFAALQSGELDEETAQQYIEALQKLYEVIAGSEEFYGYEGTPLAEGVANVLKEYNWDTDATTVAQNLGDAIARMLLIYPPKVEVEPEVEVTEPEIEEPVVLTPPTVSEIPKNENLDASIEYVQALTNEIDAYQKKIDALRESGEERDEDGNSINALENTKALLTTDLSAAIQRLSEADLSALSTEIASIVSALSSGELSPEDAATYQQRLQEILSFITTADNYLGTGNYISAGIAAGMTEYGWTTDASTVASDIKSAVDSALGVASPATTMKPTGQYVSAGIGEGMKEYDWESTASELSSSLKTVLNTNLAGAGIRSVGYHVMTGLAVGILKGKSIVTASMRMAARAAVRAAKDELIIESPSHVFRDEVGVMVMKGFGQGILEESENQAKVIRNASRFLTDEAKEASIGYNTSYDQRKYDQSSSVNLTVGSLNVRSDQDIHDLAVEIAGLTRRQQRGKGMRMA